MKLPLKTVAAALEMPVSKLERWIRQGRIPIQQSGGHGMFSTAALKKWAAAHHLPFSLTGDQDDDEEVEALGSLVSAMQAGKGCHRVTGRDVSTVLRSAVDCIDVLAQTSKGELFEKLIARERLASTGIGNGIAIPHPRDPLSRPPATPVIATCFPERPVDFNAIDDQPVSVLFLMISPSVKHHLHLLSRLSYCIRDMAFVTFLRSQPDAASLFDRVAAFENQLDAR